MRWAIKHKSGRTLFVTSDEFIANNRRKMGWIVEEVMSKCQKCNNTGMVDSGGVQPWGEPILIECDCVMEEAKITSRKQFNEWFYEYTGCDPKDSRYVNMVEMYWMAWQASREAIEIESPDFIDSRTALDKGYTVDYSNGFGDAMDAYELAIEQAGLKVKK